MKTKIAIGVAGLIAALLLLTHHSFAQHAHASAKDDLFTAAMKGNLARVDELLSGGVDVNEVRKDGATALMAASSTGRLDVVKLLLAKGANVNARTASGWDALFVISQDLSTT